MGASPTGVGPENERAGEGEQQLQMTDPSSRQRGCYLRTVTADGQLGKNILSVSLKGLGAKTNLLAVNRQSYSNSDFDSDSNKIPV
jgi:hypothetical protein